MLFNVLVIPVPIEVCPNVSETSIQYQFSIFGLNSVMVWEVVDLLLIEVTDVFSPLSDPEVKRLYCLKSPSDDSLQLMVICVVSYSTDSTFTDVGTGSNEEETISPLVS